MEGHHKAKYRRSLSKTEQMSIETWVLKRPLYLFYNRIFEVNFLGAVQLLLLYHDWFQDLVGLYDVIYIDNV